MEKEVITTIEIDLVGTEVGGGVSGSKNLTVVQKLTY
jgi:hypothetical protein